MKKIILSLTFLSFLVNIQAQLVITEIMYNPPESGADSTEYIELLNNSGSAISLLNYTFVEGIDMVFTDTVIASGDYLVVTKNTASFAAYYGFNALQWASGSLNNSGEDIVLENAIGDQVDIVDYSDSGDWPTEPDGQGYSLELCDPNKDNNDPGNWKASQTVTGINIAGIDLFASPGIANEVTCDDLITHTIDVGNFFFDPTNLTINPGETVQWINNSGGSHNVNGSKDTYPANPEGFYSGPASSSNWAFQHTFTEAGLYDYRCDPHFAFGMKGTINVLAPELSKLVITEIMYNDPGENDSLEFIELYNLGSDPIQLESYTIESAGFSHIFSNFTLDAETHLVICRYKEKFTQYFGFEPIEWDNGALSNDGVQLLLKDADGNIIDDVNYSNTSPWPGQASGLGYSMSLCRPELDNNLAENWQETGISAGFEYKGLEIFANPGQASYCSYTIGEISQNDSIGSILYSNLGVEISGTVYGVNLRQGALQFTLIDENNDGIGIFSADKDFGYQLNEGDAITIFGMTGQYNGFSQVYPDTLLSFNQQNSLFDPTVVTVLGEDTESQLVTIENVHVVDPGDWTSNGSGFNVQISNGTDNFTMRIDNDVELYSMNYPAGTFNVTGIGGQFDNSAPYDDGYQLLPRYMSDIVPYNVTETPSYTIGEITSIDEEGVADSIDIVCRIQGTVYGINFRPSGLSFTLIDAFNDGINIFSNSSNLSYSVHEGDIISIKGKVDQYKGLIEMIPEEIELISTNNPLNSPTIVLELNEDTESQLVQIQNVNIINAADWKGDGSSFNVDITDGINDFTIRIDGDCELSSMAAPEQAFNISGLGGQYDSSKPYNSGYQIFPRYADDIDIIGHTDDNNIGTKILIKPNPAQAWFSYQSDIQIDKIIVFNMLGKKLKSFDNTNNLQKYEIGELPDGQYIVLFIANDKLGTKKLQVKK